MSQLVKKIRTDQGDLQIDYNALANLPTISNPNLLINSDFRNPINQRGKTIYEGQTTKIYTVDKWCLNTSSVDRMVKILDGYLNFINNSSTFGYFIQHFENKLPKDYYTITVNVKAISGSVWVGNVLGKSSQSVEWGNVKSFKLSSGINTFTFFGELMGLYFLADPSSAVDLYWVKLEQGVVSTSFVPRLYADELALCRRYSAMFNLKWNTFMYGENMAWFSIPLSNEMIDAKKYITTTNTTYSFIAAGGTTFNDIVIDSINYEIVNGEAIIQVGGNYGATTFIPAMVFDDFNIFIDCDLY